MNQKKVKHTKRLLTVLFVKVNNRLPSKEELRAFEKAAKHGG